MLIASPSQMQIVWHGYVHHEIWAMEIGVDHIIRRKASNTNYVLIMYKSGTFKVKLS